jgi:hypothetical protein
VLIPQRRFATHIKRHCSRCPIRNCSLEEGENGEIINSKTGKPFDGKDPCIEKGVHIGYNAAAYQATLIAVKDFLRATFNIK